MIHQHLQAFFGKVSVFRYVAPKLTEIHKFSKKGPIWSDFHSKMAPGVKRGKYGQKRFFSRFIYIIWVQNK